MFAFLRGFKTGMEEHTIYLYVVDEAGELGMYLGRAPCVGWWGWGPVP